MEIDWANISALGCVLVCMVWGITKGIPSMMMHFSEELKESRETFSAELRQQRQDFRDELAECRNHSTMLLARMTEDT